MKKILYFCLLTLVSSPLISQVQSKMEIALRHLEQNHSSMGLEKSDYKDMLLSHMHTDRSGVTYVYFNQSIDNIPIKNAILNYTISKEGKVAFVANTFVSNKLKKTAKGKANFNAEASLESAAKHLGYPNFRAPSVASRSETEITFKASSICDKPIVAHPNYTLTKDKTQLIPSWEFSMDMTDNADYWEIRVSKIDGAVISKNNFTVYCKHEHGKYAKHIKHDHCQGHKADQIKHEAVKVTDVLTAAPSYKVYALPGESPNHIGHSIVVSPHYTESSPFGWHDTNGVDGAEHTTTKGNNVEAYIDKDDDDSQDSDAPQPDGGAGLLFDFAHDQAKEPTDSPLAAQTNLFYMVNMLHDILSLYGFDEEAGNFQDKNYSNKGKGGDYVLAQAFDGFNLTPQSLNNANFSTPPDGVSGIMQMFLWGSPVSAVKIDAPSDLAGPILEYGTADFGSPIPTATEAPIQGRIIVAKDADFTNPTICCKPIVTDLTGRIALIDRGGCNFSLKAKLAEDRGAIGVIICNIPGVSGGTGEEISNMTAGSVTPQKVTSIFLKKSDCDKIRAKLTQEIDVTMTIKNEVNTGPEFIDGAYDNGVIAHEFGHGVSTRLTGGPANSGCLINEEQMGEGWSDFFSLILTVEPGDKGTDSRGIGTYAGGELTSGRGIRRFPYSTDMNINPQTFDDIKGNKNAQGVVSPHPVGEVWTDCLWDLYWKLVEKYGYDANWRNFESGNARTLKLVIQAMKMQGCDPGFVRGRDAILAADSLLYGGTNGYDIWDVFARRGLGFNVDGGDADDINDGVENFDTNPYKIELLKIEKSDFDLIKANTEVPVSLSTVNHVKTTQGGVVVIDDLPPGFTYVNNSGTPNGVVNGNKIEFNLGNVAFDQKSTINYKIKSGSEKSIAFKQFGFNDSENDWQVDILEGSTLFNVTDADKKSGTTSFYAYGEATETDLLLISPPLDVVGDNPALRFWHKFDTEISTDGGFLEISEDGGNVWKIIRDGFIKNGYNSEISYSTFAIPALKGFTGSSNGKFIDSYLDLSPWKGKTINVRFRYGSNATVTSTAALPGWFIDDIELMDLVIYETKACIANQQDENGSCSVVRKLILDTDGSVDTKNIDYVTSYSLYPNPADDYIVLDMLSSRAGNLQAYVTTIEGRVIVNKNLRLSIGRNAETLITNDFKPGIYLLKLQDGTSSVTKKFVIH